MSENQKHHRKMRILSYRKPIEETKTGEIKYDISTLQKLKENDIYYVQYTTAILKKNISFCGVLKNQKNYSYIFEKIKILEKSEQNKIIHKRCKYSIPKYWVSTVNLTHLSQIIPLDIILHEILEYLD
jgi:hypothetical protein